MFVLQNLALTISQIPDITYLEEEIHENRHGSGKPGWCIKLAEYARGNRADRAVDVIFCLGSFKPTAKLDEFSNRF